MLHLLFLAERTLKEWMDRGMQFQVFFFKMEKKLSFEKEPFDNQMIQVARELLREHMRRALHLTVVNFSGTPFENNGEWDSYLKKTLPSFIITRLSSEYERRFANECKRRGFAIAVDLRLTSFLIFLFFLCIQTGTEVKGYSMDVRNLRSKGVFITSAKDLPQSNKVPTKLFEVSPLCSKIAKAVEGELSPEMNVCLLAVLELLCLHQKEPETFGNFFHLSQILLLSVSLLESLPLERRYFHLNLLKDETPLVKQFLSPFFKLLKKLLPAYLLNMTRYFDLFDGRLFHKLFSEYSKRVSGIDVYLLLFLFLWLIDR